MTHSTTRILLGTCLFALLAGCGGTTLLMKEGSGSSDLTRDRSICREQVTRAPITIAFAIDQRGNVRDYKEVPRNMLECLAQRGWVRADG